MKSMKKLVLAALILLASVVVLAGCKNDSVPQVPKYTVKFETEHGTAPASITVESGTKLTAEQLKALPDTVDNIFEGWYDGEIQAKSGEYTVTKDVTLVARWRNRDTVASVTFDPSSTKLYYSETVTLATATEGATIHYQLGDEEWKIYNEAISITSDTTITAYATKAGLKDSTKRTATYTVRKLTGISITPLTRTVYSVGESFDGSYMVVTATYDDEKYRKVTGWTTNFDEVTREKGLKKEVTVSYTEGDNKKTATFTVDVASYQFTETVQNYEYPVGKTGTASATSTPAVANPLYKKFGDWPQTIKAADVTVGSETLVRGGLSYYVGSDGNYYVKVTADPYWDNDGYTYSDNSGVTEGSDVYFKVEPIIWRVLNAKDGKYNESENPLLLAENILTGGIKWHRFDNNNYMESNIRKWLNGNSGSGAESDYNGGAGFLQTAFTSEAQGLITPTTVDNSATSTLPNILTEEQKTTDWNNGKNDYACGDTTDKIFLLSEQEATMSNYGFAEYTAYGQGNTRIRVTTDYAKATGASQRAEAGAGGVWWLRSPFRRSWSDRSYAYYIPGTGYADSYANVPTNIEVGIVPALSISINGN